MIRDALYIAGNDLRIMIRNKETILWIFVMPLVFFFFIGKITQGGGIMGPVSLAVQVPENAGFLADEIIDRLMQQDLKIISEFEGEYKFDDYTRRLLIPENFTEKVLAGDQQTIVFRRRGEGLSSSYDQFRIYRGVNTVLADLVAAGELTEGHVSASTLADLQAIPRALSLNVKQAGQREEIPSGFDQAVPGIMVMFTLLVLLTSGATTLLTERRQGLLRRLASAPMSRTSVVGGKWIGKLALGLVQIAFAMIVGRLLFKVSWGPNLPMVLLLMFAYASLISCFGILLGNLARSEGQAIGFGVLTANLFAALGGCWWPIEVTSPFMQKLALFLPTGWAMDAMHKLVHFGKPAASALPHVVGMLALSLILIKVCARTFKFE